MLGLAILKHPDRARHLLKSFVNFEGMLALEVSAPCPAAPTGLKALVGRL